ncbi:MAG: hypothetical protein J1E56_01620 [Ruminococcus sp.]|nr:hypothetical protein [Ruminococcus sp.]
MKKRAGALALIFAIIFVFCSCSDDVNNKKSSTQPTTQEPSTANKTDNNDFTDKYAAVDLTFGYDGLENEAQRACYKAMAEISGVITDTTSDSNSYLTEEKFISMEVKDKDIFIALTAYKYDNPGDFWVKESFTSSHYNGGAGIRLCSYYSAEELSRKRAEFDNKVSEILEPIESGMSEYDRELYLHNYLIENCEYDNKVAELINNNIPSDSEEAFTAYGALIDGNAVCQGYSDAMSYLLSCVGIENTEISGTSQGGNHIWNAVKIDGDWYYLDVTWDDQKDQVYQYDYFNITTSQLEYDHTIAETFGNMTEEEITGGESNLGRNFNIFIPDCTVQSENYYVKNGAVLQGFDEESDNVMGEELLKVALSEDAYYNIYVDEDYVDYENACEQLFDPYIYHFQNYVDYANNRLSEYQIDYSAAIIKKDKLNVITVKLTYI